MFVRAAEPFDRFVGQRRLPLIRHRLRLIVNSGNERYMIATLQMLVRVPAMSSYFSARVLMWICLCTQNNWRLLIAILDALLRGNSSTPLTLQCLRHYLRHAGQQQDAYEWLQEWMQTLHQATLRPGNSGSCTPSASPLPGETVTQHADRAWANLHFSNGQNTVSDLLIYNSDLFQVQILSHSGGLAERVVAHRV